ncbi:MAG: pirin family protein [Bdellovibrionales bacterium]
MLQLRKSGERGHANHGWLESFHTFSFADYYDPSNMGFRVLRVINEDKISGGKGFPTHPHQDMEIITYLVEGALEHKDSMGTSSVIYPGEVQHMSAGTGVQHSEFNHFKDKSSHLLQIWLLPDQKAVKPMYGQKSFAKDLENKELVLAASPGGRDGSLPIHQDVDLYVAKWPGAKEFNFRFRAKSRYGWVQLVSGSLEANDLKLSPGDGLSVAGEEQILFKSKGPVEFIVFDLP